jgi:hypothetical protein
VQAVDFRAGQNFGDAQAAKLGEPTSERTAVVAARKE